MTINHPLAFLHLVICVIYSLYIVYGFKVKHYSFLAISVLVFILFDSFGLGLVFLFPQLSTIKEYLHTYKPIVREPYLIYRAYLSHWTFFFVSFFFIVISRNFLKPRKTLILRINNRWGVTFVIIGIIFSLKYFLFGPGFNVLLDTRLFFGSVVEAVAYRSEARDLIGLGQGQYLASLGAKIFFPLGAIVFLFNKRKIAFILCSILPVLYGLTTRQKAPIIIPVLFLFGGLVLFSKIDKKRIVAVGFGSLFLASISFLIMFGFGAYDSLIATFWRLVMVPGSTEYNFFIAFPDLIDFRGLSGLLKIPVGAWGENGVTIYQVAYATTRNIFSSNANFIAVAWSALGFHGVFLASLILSFVLFIFDLFYKGINLHQFAIVNLFMIYSYLGLVSDSLSPFLFGLSIPGLIYFVTKLQKVRIFRRKRKNSLIPLPKKGVIPEHESQF